MTKILEEKSVSLLVSPVFDVTFSLFFVVLISILFLAFCPPIPPIFDVFTLKFSFHFAFDDR